MYQKLQFMLRYVNTRNALPGFMAFFLLFVFSFAICQEMADLPLTNKQSILNGKAWFRFPAGAVNSARATDLMAADPNINQETRIVLDIDKMRIVFFAEELFRLGNKNLLNSVAMDDKNFRNSILAEKDSLQAILSTPITFDSTKNAILLNSLLVKTQDNTLFRISAYVNPQGFPLKAQFQKLTERVFASIMKGDRRINLKPRRETFSILDGKKSFLIDLPENMVVIKDKKYDFEVLKFQKLNDVADTNWLNLTIYTGFYPSYFYKEYGLSAKDATETKGKFLQQEVSWLNFGNQQNHFILREQIIPGNTIEERLQIHVAMLSNQPSVIDDLTRFIATIKVKNTK
jgi:hypothetical protein